MHPELISFAFQESSGDLWLGCKAIGSSTFCNDLKSKADELLHGQGNASQICPTIQCLTLFNASQVSVLDVQGTNREFGYKDATSHLRSKWEVSIRPGIISDCIAGDCSASAVSTKSYVPI